MTAAPFEQPAPARTYPGKSLDAITPVFDNPDVDAEIRDRFKTAYATAWVTARDGLTVQPLLDLVEHWWPQAVHWSDPNAARELDARAERYLRDGIPPEDRIPAADVYAEWERRHPGQKLRAAH